MPKPLLLPLALAALAAGLPAQWIPLNPVTGVQQQSNSVLLTMQSGAMRIEVANDSIIHVVYSPTSSFPKQAEYVVTKTAWPTPQWKMESTGAAIVLTTPRLKVTVSRADGVIAYSDLAGKKLVAEGPKTMTPATVNGENTYHAEDNISMYGSEEGLYGLGQHQAGVWNYRGDSVDVSQDNTSIAVPLLVSTNGYGLFWNNASRMRFNNRFVHSLYISAEVADTIDYYFLYGPDFDKIVAGYRELTGAAPMFGKWAYGFWQCKNKYQSQQEMLGVAHKYRELHIPVDNIVQDWFWWTTKGEFVFNKNYPDAKGMIDDLHKNNFHLMISVWPYFDPGTATYADMDKRGFFIDRTKTRAYHPAGMAVYDATNPDARAYYWNLMDKALFQIGADAWWLDTTEPETEGREENLMLNNKLAIGSGARYANIFPLMTTTAVYDGQRKASDRKRVYHSVALGVRGRAAQRGDGVVGRYSLRLRNLQAPDTRRLEFLSIRHPLLDHGHRRLFHRQSERSGVPRAIRALVSVRHVLPDLSRARNPHHQSERALVVRTGRANDPDPVRSLAL